MIRRMMVILAMAMLILPQAVLAGDGINYSGSSTIGMGVLEEGAVKAFEKKTGIKFVSIDQPGSGKVINNTVEVIPGNLVGFNSRHFLTAKLRQESGKTFFIGLYVSDVGAQANGLFSVVTENIMKSGNQTYLRQFF